MWGLLRLAPIMFWTRSLWVVKPSPFISSCLQTWPVCKQPPVYTVVNGKSNLSLMWFLPSTSVHVVRKTLCKERQLAAASKITYGCNLARRWRSYFANWWPLSGGTLALAICAADFRPDRRLPRQYWHTHTEPCKSGLNGQNNFFFVNVCSAQPGNCAL